MLETTEKLFCSGGLGACSSLKIKNLDENSIREEFESGRQTSRNDVHDGAMRITCATGSGDLG